MLPSCVLMTSTSPGECVAQIDRFSVNDPRPLAEVEEQHAVQKLIRKAFREAKAARQKQKEKARAARALAAKEQQLVRKYTH